MCTFELSELFLFQESVLSFIARHDDQVHLPQWSGFIVSRNNSLDEVEISPLILNHFVDFRIYYDILNYIAFLFFYSDRYRLNRKKIEQLANWTT